MRSDWIIRRYLEVDRQVLLNFTCTTPGQRWTKPAQRAIRAAPSVLDEASPDRPTVFVACEREDTGRVLGVIVFGPDGGRLVIHTIGVVRDRRREGIGIALKRAALAELVADGRSREVFSTVHKHNVPMTSLNAKLGVQTTKDPEDGDYLLSGILAVPGVPSTDQDHSALRRAVTRLLRVDRSH